ncbi:MAG TPA: ABC transporter permease subunit, partial [Devosia sp.]|nr:ABC transporter permease subunit [Devosia sp.]
MNNWERFVWNQREALLEGLRVTVEISSIAFVCAVVLGLSLCLLRLYVPLLRPIATLLIEFFRAVPILVQLMWVAYVWPELFGWPKDFYTAAWVALAVQSSGYLAETFRSEIRAIAPGHREAATALGMSPVLMLRRIVLPQALL